VELEGDGLAGRNQLRKDRNWQGKDDQQETTSRQWAPAGETATSAIAVPWHDSHLIGWRLSSYERLLTKDCTAIRAGKSTEPGMKDLVVQEKSPQR
jgi:hypothetical protein